VHELQRQALPDGEWASRVRVAVETARFEARCFAGFMAYGGWNQNARPRRTIVQAYAQWRECQPGPMTPLDTADLAAAVAVLRREHQKRGPVSAGPGDGGPLRQTADPSNPPWTYVDDTCLRALALAFKQEWPAELQANMCTVACQLLGRTAPAVAGRMALILGHMRSQQTGASGKRKILDDAGGDDATTDAEHTRAGDPICTTVVAAKDALKNASDLSSAMRGVLETWGTSEGQPSVPQDVPIATVADLVQHAVLEAEEEEARFAEFVSGGRFHIVDRNVAIRAKYETWRSKEAGRRKWPDLEHADRVMDTLVSELQAFVRRRHGQMNACRSYVCGGVWTIVEDAGLRVLAGQMAGKMSVRAISNLGATLLANRNASQVLRRMRHLGCVTPLDGHARGVGVKQPKPRPGSSESGAPLTDSVSEMANA